MKGAGTTGAAAIKGNKGLKAAVGIEAIAAELNGR
jgi:hypothetical protein